MSNANTINAANSLMVQSLAAQSYLSPNPLHPARTIEGGTITTKRIPNRSNVPADAITLTHLVEHPGQGFSFRFRAVWHQAQLLRPSATFVVIEQEWDDAQHGSPAAVSAAINDWLQAVTP